MLNETQAEQAYEIISAMAAWCHDDYWRDELIQFAALPVVMEETDIATAYANAVRHVATAQRYERNALSLDGQTETFGDALHMSEIPAPSRSYEAIKKARQRAHEKATPREPERGIEELGLEDETLFPTVLRNDYQRGILPEVGELAIDIELQPKRHATLLRLILSSVTKGELRERGYKTSEIVGATQFLTDYYAMPPSR